MNVVLQVIIAVPLFILFAWFARRLLGVRRLSAIKTVIAALIGFIAAEIIAHLLVRQDFSTDLAIVAGLVLGLLATMLVIVGFEALANPAKSALERSFGRSVDEVFREFDWDPIGAASIGQVYRAQLKSGEPVVVKVRRPDIEETVDGDLQIALDLAAFAEERSPQAKNLGIVGVADQFAAQLRDELDYRIEARNTLEVAAAVADIEPITVPKVHGDLSGESVLVIGFVEGEPLGRHGAIGGDHGRSLAEDLFRAELDAMLTGERFHADPHPGNVMIRPDGKLGLIDFGSAGRLDAVERAAVADILMAISNNDPTLLRSAAIQVGMGDADVDPGKLDRAFARLMADHLGPGAEVSISFLQDFISIANSCADNQQPLTNPRAAASLDRP